MTEAIPEARKMISDPVELEVPISRGGGSQTIASLQLRRPASGELRGLNLSDILKLDVTALHTLLPRVTVPLITADEARAIDPVDLVQLAGELGDFFVPKALKQESPPASME